MECGKMKQENKCKKFATLMAKQKGLSYAEATKKYPRGFEKNSVYIDATCLRFGHCVHCARAEALASESERGDLQ